tara:strand:+ start:4558 stop:7359 length:2802 start_codon:yes stop_codon:yes gene_type:complete
MSDEEERELGFNLLKDQPLSLEDDDRFGYVRIAKALQRLIVVAEPPFTIGLFGQWGSGKSTVCFLLASLFEKDKSLKGKYGVYYFDTWKYERDSFRRQFLIKLDKTFKLGLNFSETLNHSLTKYSAPTVKEIWKVAWANMLLRILVVLVALAVIAWGVTRFTDTKDIFSDVLLLLTSTGLIGIFVTFIINSIQSLHKTEQYGRPDSAEGFEKHFNEAITKIRKEKVVIMIDNLDRLTHEKAVELLSDIKTFLANRDRNDEVKDKVIFVVPCDNKAIGKQLQQAYSDPEFDSDEYLRKFFNVSIRIPRLLDSEIDNYIHEMLKETGVSAFSECERLVFVIEQAFRNSPREIIQFVNGLTATYLIASEAELDYVIDKDNLAFFARVQVIKAKWPNIYEEIEKRKLRTAETLTDINGSMDSSLKNEEYTAFMNATSHIENAREEVFFSLKESEEQKRVPEWESFVVAAESQDIDAVRKIYSNVKTNGLEHEFFLLLTTYLRQNKDNHDKKLNTLLSLQEVLTPENIESFGQFLDSLHHIPADVVESSFEKLDFEKIYNENFQKVDSAYRKTVISKHIELLRLVAKQDHEKTMKVFPKINTLIDSLFSQTGNLIRQYETEIRQVRGKIVSEFPILNFFNSDMVAENPTLKNSLDEYLTLASNTNFPYGKRCAKFLEQYKLLLEQTFVQNDKELLERILRTSKSVIESKCTSWKSDEDKQSLKIFTSQLVSLNMTQHGEETRTIIMQICEALNFAENPMQSDVQNRLGSYIRDTSVSGKDIIDAFGGKTKMKKKDFLKDWVLERTRIKPDIFLAFGDKGYFTADQNNSITNDLAGQKPQDFADFLKLINYEIPDSYAGNSDFKRNILTNMINRSGLNSDLIPTWLDTIGKSNLPEDMRQLLFEKMLNEWKPLNSGAVSSFAKKNKKWFTEEQFKKLTT